VPLISRRSSTRAKLACGRMATAAASHSHRGAGRLLQRVTGIAVQAVKVAGMAVISLALIGRSALLFIRFDVKTAVSIVLYGVLSWLCGAGKVALCTLTAALVGLAVLLHDMPTDNAGHRAGGHGFGSALQENTVEALQALLARSSPGPLPELAYVEFDIHETRDGELLVFHDDTLARALPAGPGINTAPEASLLAQGLDARRAPLSALTAAQVLSFHLGGRVGCHVPTLEQYLRVCLEAGLRHSIAVEIKGLRTDAGRQKLLELLQRYIKQSEGARSGRGEGKLYAHFGPAAVIAFPWAWAAAMGEFGTRENGHWARAFAAAGIPVKSCVLHSLSLTYGF